MKVRMILVGEIALLVEGIADLTKQHKAGPIYLVQFFAHLGTQRPSFVIKWGHCPARHLSKPSWLTYHISVVLIGKYVGVEGDIIYEKFCTYSLTLDYIN